MKWIFGVICLTASLAAVSATFCSSEDDCPAGKCCVALTARQMSNKGLCLRLAKERRSCSEPESKMDYYGGKFMKYCPCGEGMVCEPKNPAITDPTKRRNSLICKKTSGTTVGPDVSTDAEIVTDGEVVETNPPDEVTDDIVDETLPPEIVTDAPEETEAPEEETEAPEEETEAPEEEVVETDAPEEEVVEEETEAPEEEVVEEETEAPEEEVVEEETEAPEEEVVDENPEEEVVEEAGQRGPGGERPREDDPDCEDWTYGC